MSKYTPTGFATINRATFTVLYNEVRPTAFNARNIRAGWKRSGLWPLNPARIKEDPEVRNFGRTTPEYQPSQRIHGDLGTPKKVEDYERIARQLQIETTPSKHRKIRSLAHGAVQELTANQVLANDLRELRSHTVTKEVKKRTLRLQKEVQQRSWNLEQITQARATLRACRIVKQRKRKPKSLILSIPI